MLSYIKEGIKIVVDRRARKRFWGYRPVVACLIQASNDDGKFLFIAPAAKSHAWMPPQEGIEPNDSIESAILRCMRAELGIEENQLQIRRTVWLGCHKIPEQQGERDVLFSPFNMKGKAYYAALVKTPLDVSLKLNPAEVASAEWLTLESISDTLHTNSERKQLLIKSAFSKLLERVDILGDKANVFDHSIQNEENANLGNEND